MKAQRLLFIFLITFYTIVFLGCSRSEEVNPTRPSPVEEAVASPVASTKPSPTPAVRLTTDKTVYQLGETVHYTITNNAEGSVWYLIGDCFIPHIVRIEDEREIDLITYILEEEIVARELPAGENIACTWGQWAYWSPNEQGTGRFQGGMQTHQVPPGRYQFRFRYGFEEDHAYSRHPSISTLVKSPVFTIQ